ncbi:MAG: DUF4412 domain-containing protein [Terriglobales bacterium]
MNKAAWLACVILVPLALAQAGRGAFNVDHFSATLEMAMPGRGSAMSMKVYKSGDKMRTDLPSGAGYTVVEVSSHKTFMVMGGGMCMEMSTPTQSQPNPFAAQGQVETKSLGNETVDGHACQVEQITVTPAGGGPAQVMKAWLAADLQNFPVRVEMQSARGPMQINYKDVSLAEPDATLFAEPSGCRPMPGIPHP